MPRAHQTCPAGSVRSSAGCLTPEGGECQSRPLSHHYPCPGCGNPVGFQVLRCSHCDASLLFGLIAPPVDEPRRLDAAAAALAGFPGGPPLSEARRRLRGGLPLLVGVTRQRAEELQGKLLDLGVVARLGPAPRGSRPLGGEHAGSGVLSRFLLALLVPGLAVAIFWGVDRIRSRQREADMAREGAPPVVGVPQRRLLANATVIRTRVGWMILEGRVQVVSADLQPQGEIELSLRQGPTTLWRHSFTPPEPRHPGGTRSARFRASLHELPLEGGEQLVLEVLWDGWRADPVELTTPNAPR